jgi:hypothetical protein
MNVERTKVAKMCTTCCGARRIWEYASKGLTVLAQIQVEGISAST